MQEFRITSSLTRINPLIHVQEFKSSPEIASTSIDQLELEYRMSKANAILRGTISKPVSYTSFALFMVTIILALINAFLYEFNLVMYFIGLGCYTFGIVMMCAHVVYGYRNACASLRELAKDWKDCEFDFSNIGMFKSRRFIMVYRIGSVDNV